MERLIELNGFSLKRRGRHLVYQNAQGHNFVTAATPSDYRAEMNIRKELERVCRRLGQKFIEHEPQKEKPVNQFNTPRVVTQNVPNIAPVPSAPQPPKVKTMDAEALRICIEGMKNKIGQQKISDILNGLHYTTVTGLPLQQKDVSLFLNKNGYKYKNTTPTIATSDGEVKRPISRSKFIDQVTEILSSNLSDDMKEVLLIKFVEDRKK